MDERNWFTAGEASLLSGIGYPQLDYLGRKELLVPSIQTASGKGTDRKYSFGDVFLLKVIQQLRSLGLEWSDSLPWIQWLRDSEQPGAGAEADELQYLVSDDGHHVMPYTAEHLTTSLLSGGEVGVWIILNVRGLLAQFRQQVAELRANGKLT